MKQHHKTVRRNTVRNIFIGVGVPLFSLCLTFLFLYLCVPVRYSPPAEKSTVLEGPPREVVTIATINPPVRVEIKSINVSAAIKPVGLTVDGDMAIDDNAEEVAWYQPGEKPGEVGSAVIAGHYGWKDGVASVFNDLHTLVAGDIISTYDATGKAQSFTVMSSRVYDPDADATSVFRSDDGKAHLNLITCQGTWNNTQQTYSERLVVFAVAIE